MVCSLISQHSRDKTGVCRCLSFYNGSLAVFANLLSSNTRDFTGNLGSHDLNSYLSDFTDCVSYATQ